MQTIAFSDILEYLQGKDQPSIRFMVFANHQAFQYQSYGRIKPQMQTTANIFLPVLVKVGQPVSCI